MAHRPVRPDEFDLSDPEAVRAEAARRAARRRAGLPLHDAPGANGVDGPSSHRGVPVVQGGASGRSPRDSTPTLPAGVEGRKTDEGRLGGVAGRAVPPGWREQDEQRLIWRILRALGWRAYWLSQARRTGQTRGLADIYALHEGRGLAMWCEMKRPVDPAAVTSEQRTFAEANVRCGVHAIIGTADDVVAWLRGQGFDPPPVVRTL